MMMSYRQNYFSILPLEYPLAHPPSIVRGVHPKPLSLHNRKARKIQRTILKHVFDSVSDTPSLPILRSNNLPKITFRFYLQNIPLRIHPPLYGAYTPTPLSLHNRKARSIRSPQERSKYRPYPPPYRQTNKHTHTHRYVTHPLSGDYLRCHSLRPSDHTYPLSEFSPHDRTRTKPLRHAL